MEYPKKATYEVEYWDCGLGPITGHRHSTCDAAKKCADRAANIASSGTRFDCGQGHRHKTESAAMKCRHKAHDLTLLKNRPDGARIAAEITKASIAGTPQATLFRLHRVKNNDANYRYVSGFIRELVEQSELKKQFAEDTNDGYPRHELVDVGPYPVVIWSGEERIVETRTHRRLLVDKSTKLVKAKRKLLEWLRYEPVEQMRRHPRYWVREIDRYIEKQT